MELYDSVPHVRSLKFPDSTFCCWIAFKPGWRFR